MEMAFPWIEDILTEPACTRPTAEPLVRRTMAKTLTGELRCDKRLEGLYEKGLFDPQHGQIPLEEEKTLAQITYVNSRDRGYQHEHRDLVFFGESEELRSKITSSSGEHEDSD